MSQPFVGEIRIFAGNFAPAGWAFCRGQLMAIAENDTLFALIGTIYGGDGQTTFGLPNLQSRLPLNQGQGPGLSNRTIGELAGVESVTLTTNQIPAHTHSLMATTSAGNTVSPGPTVVLAKPVDAIATPTLYVVPGTSTVNVVPMAANSIGTVGGSQPHTNIMPFLAMNYIISLFGIFPSRN